MSRAGASALSLLGLASAWVGALIGFAFGMPALGLNQYGRNSFEVTAVGEGLAAVLYFFGAILLVRGGRVLAEPRRPTGKVLFLALLPVIFGLVAVLVMAAKKGDWEAIPIVLIFVVFVVTPILAGMLSVWMGSRSPRPGSGPAQPRSRRQSM